MTQSATDSRPELKPSQRRSEHQAAWQTFPWWAVIIAVIMIIVGWKIFSDPDYDQAWARIVPGVRLTITTTLQAFVIAVVLGLLSGTALISRSVIARNVARTYVEIVRGIPMLPLIFTVVLVLVPGTLNWLSISNKTIPNEWRAVFALSLTYGAYISEIFRGGIQSVAPGQREAGRSLGMTQGQTMRSIVLPQAMRAIIPPMGNDFIAILKDTSLLSTIGVLEITLRSRQFGAQSFKYPEAYLTMAFIYLCLVLTLSFLLGRLEAYMTKDRKGQR